MDILRYVNPGIYTCWQKGIIDFGWMKKQIQQIANIYAARLR